MRARVGELVGVVRGADPDDVPDARVQRGADPGGGVLDRRRPGRIDAELDRKSVV